LRHPTIGATITGMRRLFASLLVCGVACTGQVGGHTGNGGGGDGAVGGGGGTPINPTTGAAGTGDPTTGAAGTGDPTTGAAGTGGSTTGVAGTGLVAALLFETIGPGPANLTVNGSASAPGGAPVALSFAPVPMVTVR